MRTFSGFLALGLLALLSGLAALAAPPRELVSLKGVKILGEFEVDRAERSTEELASEDICKEPSGKCGRRVWVLEIQAKDGPELVLLEVPSRSAPGAGYETFLLDDVPSFSEVFDRDFKPNCRGRAGNGKGLLKDFCRARAVRDPESGAIRYFFHEALREEDYRNVAVDALQDCAKAGSMVRSMLLPLPIGAADPAYWIDLDGPDGPVITRERSVSVLGFASLVRTKYFLKKVSRR